MHALTYIHIGFSRPIVFRNIKLLNILFDDEHAVKLFDFCLSVTIPEGETHVKDEVIGAMGFFAPKYKNTGNFNEKSDVFSFGVLLLALLTGKQIVDSSRRETGGEYYLLDHVKKYNENGRFEDLIDRMIADDVSCSRKDPVWLQDFTEIAFKCVSESEEERPTMIDVAKQLR
ncbi:hypothetical protein LWI28_006991 [Acer negundo]|uniref:non-specific serine/threonine protein kinase n=1 Tax=Acer negundo TaxID=4023 RepID=A0AAD5J3S7_ACENE|nr:hypothetical protein LWI28_006991 [Acer negundo]